MARYYNPARLRSRRPPPDPDLTELLQKSLRGEKPHEAGHLHSEDEEYHWFKCPRHGTWLQPELKPHPHWACKSVNVCTYKRAAKMRTKIERDIFRHFQFMMEQADHGKKEE